jgi:hypothetical protein
MESDKIDIAKHLVRLEESGSPVDNIVPVSLDIAEEIKNVLRTREKLRVKDNQFPILETYPTRSTEICMWAVAALSSAWTQWCFTAKTNNPKYQQDPNHAEAAENVKIALPYVKTLIIDTMSIAEEIASKDTGDDKIAYRPESAPAYIELRKE